jgi:hypothetical protein
MASEDDTMEKMIESVGKQSKVLRDMRYAPLQESVSSTNYNQSNVLLIKQ